MTSSPGRLAGTVALALLSGFALLAPPRLHGAVGGSPHDLVAQGYHVARSADELEACLACHMPPGAKMANFLSEPPPSLEDFDTASLTCFSCHDGTTMVNPDVDASVTAFHPLSHRYDLKRYRSQLPEDGSLPHLGGERMTCLTCHDPHENSNRPFLRNEMGGLCLACHAAFANDRSQPSQPAFDDHPILLDPATALKERIPVKVDPRFTVDFPGPYPLTEGRNTKGVHWDLGGHLDEGDRGRIACFTCHVVHGDEDQGPLAALLTLDPVKDNADLFCEACHRGRRGDELPSPPYPNPGGTTTARTYHPADNDEGNGPGRIVGTVDPEGWPFGSAEGKPLLCTTCHVAHKSRPESALLRRGGGTTPFCAECHASLPPHHHPMGGEGEVKCLSNAPAAEGGGIIGELSCAQCHQAHNAGLGTESEEEYVPILRMSSDPEKLCITCHPEDDPTCSTIPGYTASHFMGDPTRSDTYNDSEPPLRTDAWPESQVESDYGANGKTITCLSCHTFRKGAVTSGDDGTTGYLLALSGNNVEWEGESGENYYLCTGCHTAAPSTEKQGHTHPLMDADISKLLSPPVLPVTSTSSGRVNCDSCHRPHNAPDNGGYYIMEVIGSANTDPKAIHPQIDYTVLCHSCHDPTEY